MSKSIKVLGTGCAKCQSMSKVVKEVIEANNLDVNFEKIEDIMEIMNYNVMVTPALVIDEEVKIKGRIPSKDEILKLLM